MKMKNKIWNRVDSISRGGILEADLFYDGGEEWKVEVRFIENGALHKRRYFKWIHGVREKAYAFASGAIIYSPMSFSHKRVNIKL